PALRRQMERLTLWSNTAVHSFHPFLLRLYREFTLGKLAAPELEQVLSAVEGFLVRRLFIAARPDDDNQRFLQIYERAAGRGPGRRVPGATVGAAARLAGRRGIPGG